MDAPLDLDSVRKAAAKGHQLQFRFFWGHKARPDGALSDACFSQWWPSRFTVDSQPYATAEQFMMASKARLFRDDERLTQILAERDPKRVKALGRLVQRFDEAAWQAARFDLVTRGNVAKFGQNEKLRAYLLATRDAVLVEASPLDRIWGIGLAASDESATNPECWHGLNLLGFALMRTRAILRGELGSP